MRMFGLFRAALITLAVSVALRAGSLFAEDAARPTPEPGIPASVKSPTVPPATATQTPSVMNGYTGPGPSTIDQLLLQLRARSRTLDQREAAITMREQLLHAAEARLGARLGQLTALQSRLDAEDEARKAREAADWTGLVRTYESMKPRDAAAIFNDLDLSVLLPVLDRMKDAKAGAILAAMNADRARQVTAALARYRLQPTDHAAPNS